MMEIAKMSILPEPVRRLLFSGNGGNICGGIHSNEDPRRYFLRSTTHSQCESPCSMFLVSLKVKSGFTLSATPVPQF